MGDCPEIRGEMQPARGSERTKVGAFETVDFARRRDKRRRLNAIAKASRRKNRR
jgi:hypothetical protein